MTPGPGIRSTSRTSGYCRWSPIPCATGCRRCTLTAFTSISGPSWRVSLTGFDEGGGFLDSCRQDPVLSSVKLIAEPWDLGPGGYQVGRFPPGWAEWNERFRETVSAFWKGDEGVLPELASRVSD